MNKIEVAIANVKVNIANKNREITIARAELSQMETHLRDLEKIEDNKRIPHCEPEKTLERS